MLRDEYNRPDGLPDTVAVNIEDLDYIPEEDDVLCDVLSDWLSDTYGYCHYGFDYETDAISGDITITNILWDTSEN